ncbi:hypothetical protein C8A00DRAFT_40881 [Chaetomidium leptoderma]|uniref:Uncharacterized protein n=1 Tax=Chaetomidium leptoderma TaxID=669021 RepID=A0AAN7A1B8_9PEZI|nr:hypothetical protein C8A00DRAFT_40881 [Chaetomidium leptoderma]
MATHLSQPSTPLGPAPRYTPEDEVELARFESSSPSTLSAPPPYDQAEPSSSAFHPTVHLQIEAPGKPWLSLPLPPRPEPIAVFALHPDDASTSAAALSTPKFTSIRPERSSGSCYLTTSPPHDETTQIPALATTTYRFGPNRPPRIRLFSPHSTPSGLSPTTLHALLSSTSHDEDNNLVEGGEQDPAAVAWDTFTITPLGLLTRAIGFRTRLGTFQWRYGSRRERHAAAAAQSQQHKGQGEVSSLLVLERVVHVAAAQTSSVPNKKKDEKVRTVVAHFLRGEGYRTPGSSGSTAGNGGRLVMDLGMWGGADFKEDGEMAVVMVVATCLLMLKREIDRRRTQQIAIMAGAAGN